MRYLRQVFDILIVNNISIKLEKVYVRYSIIYLFNQKINLLKLTIVKKKLKIIVDLRYLKSLQLLEIYLNLIK